MRDTPELAAEQFRAYAAIERVLAQRIAERTGADTRTDPFPSRTARQDLAGPLQAT